MPQLTLYHCPGACSSVSVCALEQTGLPYELKLVNLPKGEQSSPAYLAVSPLGKVPTLLIDGEVLTENAAILVYLNALKPEAGLFPADTSPRMLAEVQSGLSFCGGTLHPQIRGFANPQRMTTGALEPVREKSIELIHKSFRYANARFAERGWWVGEETIIDVYVNWAFSVARRTGFDVAAYPHLCGLAERLSARPAFVRLLAIEAESRSALGF